MCYDLLRDLYNKQHHWIHVIPHIRTFYLPIKLQTTVPPKNFELNSNRTKQCRRRERFDDIYSRLRVCMCANWFRENERSDTLNCFNEILITTDTSHFLHDINNVSINNITSCSSYGTIVYFTFLTRTLRNSKHGHVIILMYINQSDASFLPVKQLEHYTNAMC